MKTQHAPTPFCIFSSDCHRPKHSSSEVCWQWGVSMSRNEWIKGLEEQAIAKAEGKGE